MEYQDKEMCFLVTSLASLPQCSSEEADSHSLARAIIRYIFLVKSSIYLNDLIAIFNELNNEQQRNFIKYYDSMRVVAQVEGFRVEYDSVRENLNTYAKKIWGWIYVLFSLSVAFGSIFIFFNNLDSPVVMIVVAGMWLSEYGIGKLDVKIQSNRQEILHLSDLIHRENKEYISKSIEGAIYSLKEAGLVDKDGKITCGK